MNLSKGNILLIILVAVGIAAASVGGYFWWSSKNPAPKNNTVTKPIDETINWKTYTDTEDGFSLKLPEKWFPHRIEQTFGHETTISYPVDFPSTQNFVEGQLAGIQIYVTKGTIESLQTEAQRLISQPYSYLDSNMVFSKVDGKEAVILEAKNKHSKEVIIHTNGSSYLISMSVLPTASASEVDVFFKTFDQILSTFKFLDQNGSSGIYGMAKIGPTCPVQREGEICEKAYVGTVVIMKSGPLNDDPVSLEEFTRFQTDQNGNFRLNLPAGDYIALPYPKNAVTFSKNQIHVEENKFLEVNIQFDTGIR